MFKHKKKKKKLKQDLHTILNGIALLYSSNGKDFFYIAATKNYI